MEAKIHKCKDRPTDSPMTLENRGDGWYLYTADGDKGAKPCNFCIWCGQKLVKEIGK